MSMFRHASLAAAISLAVAGTASAQDARGHAGHGAVTPPTTHGSTVSETAKGTVTTGTRGATVSAAARQQGPTVSAAARAGTRSDDADDSKEIERDRASGATKHSKGHTAHRDDVDHDDVATEDREDAVKATRHAKAARDTAKGTTHGNKHTTARNKVRTTTNARRTARIDTDGTTRTRIGVPASANASDKARIATQYPGAMADYRHMTGAGRYHIDTNVLDANHDGMLSRDEASHNVALNGQFATVDVNSDGSISTDELRTWIRTGGLARSSLPASEALAGVGMANALQMLDTDRDGMLTRQEVRVDRSLSSRFNRLDVDRDGRLSQTELSAWTSGRTH